MDFIELYSPKAYLMIHSYDGVPCHPYLPLDRPHREP